MSSAPWLPDVAERRTSFENWTRNARQARRRTAPQELSVQSFLLYHLRFLVSAECSAAFRPFGGLCAQLNMLTIVLNLRTTESVNLGLSYFVILTSRLEEKARVRIVEPGDFFALLSSEQLGAKEQAPRDLNQFSRYESTLPQPSPGSRREL